MKKNYELSGMSCGGCVNNVKQILLQMPDITDAEIKLNPQTAVLTMNKPIALEKLQEQLHQGGKLYHQAGVLTNWGILLSPAAGAALLAVSTIVVS